MLSIKNVIKHQHKAITRPLTYGLLCFVAMVYAASFPSGVYNEYIYQYKVDVNSGPQGFRFETKASLEILYTAKQSHHEAFNLIEQEAVDADQTNTCHLDTILVRLSLHEPKFLSNSQQDNQQIIIDASRQQFPDHSLYANLLKLSNGTTIIREIYTHQSDSTTFKNIKKSILLNLLPTTHHLQSTTTKTTTSTTTPLFLHDNSHDQPELFSPDSISQVNIIAQPLRNDDIKLQQKQKKQTQEETTTKQPPTSLPTVFKSVQGEQQVTFKSRVFAQAESNLTTRFNLTLIEELKSDAHIRFDNAESISSAIKLLDKSYQLDTAQLERERKICSTHRCSTTLSQMFQDYKSALKESSMATVEASVAFLRLLDRLRDSEGTKVQDILAVLKQTSKRRGDDSSMLDILAAARTKASIQAAMKYLKLTKLTDRDLATPERFLSVLSVAAKTASKMHLKRKLQSAHYFTPTESLRLSLEAKQHTTKLASFEFIAQEFLDLFEKVPQKEWASKKIRWSSLLTLATLVNANNQENDNNNNGPVSASGVKLTNRVNELLLKELSSCSAKDTDCRIVAMQAIGNVGQLGVEQFQALRDQVLEFGRRESNTAMKILLDLLHNRPKDKPLDMTFETNLREFLRRLVYDDSQETTSRVLAAEIIVRFVPNSINIDEMLQNLPLFKNAELATMIYSRIKSLRPESINKQHDWYWKSCIINGTSQSFVKTMARTDSLNATYGVNLELLNNVKVLRESSFDVLLDTKERTQDLFSLGIFARGFEGLFDGGISGIVGAFMGGSGPEDEDAEREMAGMSLKLLGGYLRPYVFFNNLQELYQHYKKGTASHQPMTAFDGDLLLIDHDEGYPLITGFVAEQQMRGVLSIDVSGQIEVSILWSRESHSIISTKASAIVQSSQSVFTSYDKFWQSHLFSFGGQANIDFVTDAHFSEMPVKACLRVTQPAFKVRYHSRRHEQTMTDEIRRKVSRENFQVDGKSYSMNSENDQMCSDQMFAAEL